MYLPRFRLRSLMVAVAVAGVVIGGESMRRRRVDYLRQAQYHAHLQQRLVVFSPGWIPETEAEDERYRQAISRFFAKMASRPWTVYHARMKGKYLRAADRPWLPVVPDPPEP